MFTLITVQLIFFFEQLHIINGAILLWLLSVLPFLHLIANNLPIMCKSWHVPVGVVSKRYSEDYLTRVQKYVSIKKERSSKRAIFYLFTSIITFIQSLFLLWSLTLYVLDKNLQGIIFHSPLDNKTGDFGLWIRHDFSQ